MLAACPPPPGTEVQHHELFSLDVANMFCGTFLLSSLGAANVLCSLFVTPSIGGMHTLLILEPLGFFWGIKNMKMSFSAETQWVNGRFKLQVLH